MDCPVCREPMIGLEYEKVEVDYCPACAGVWLDEGELEVLLGLEAPEVAALLSGGERSRVALAKFLIQPTNVLLLDEPTNHLDKTTRRKLIEALHGYEGTIICASHDPGIVDGVATNVYEVKDLSVKELISRRRELVEAE